MKNSLKTLGRIKKFEIDEQRKILTNFLNKEDAILEQIHKLVTEFEQEKVFARENPSLADFGLYAKRFLEKREELEAQLNAIREKIAQIRDIIADMFREQKTFEIVEKNRKEREEKEEELKIQNMLDEIGTNAYIRRNDNNN